MSAPLLYRSKGLFLYGLSTEVARWSSSRWIRWNNSAKRGLCKLLVLIDTKALIFKYLG